MYISWGTMPNYLVGGIVLLLALLSGCNSSAAGGVNEDIDEVTRSIVVTIGEAVDCTTNADTVCTFEVGNTFSGGKGNAADDGDWIKVALAANTTYHLSVDPAGDSTTATLTITYRIRVDPTGDSTLANLTMHGAPATTAAPTIGSDMLWTPTATQNYYIGVVLDAVDEYTLTITAAPEGTNSCSSMDAEADCDGDSVANAMDEFDFNGCASGDADADAIPDMVLPATLANCTEDMRVLLPNGGARDNCVGISNPDQLDNEGDGIGDVCDDNDDNDLFLDIADNCPLVTNPLQEEDMVMIDGVAVMDSDDVGDACDVDLDNDGLIEIANLDALNNIRYNLAGTGYDDEADDGAGNEGSTSGAPTSATTDCTTNRGTTAAPVYLCGYELTRSLNFATPADYAAGAINMDWRPNSADPTTATNVGWQPIAHSTGFFQSHFFSAIFEGNGNTITNLYINRRDENTIGLIGANMGVIRNCALADVFVVGNAIVGGLVGWNQSGTISASSTTGSVTSATTTGGVLDGSRVGGLVGQSRSSIISDSWSSSSVTGGSNNVGGLVGFTRLNRISTSYSSGSVMGTDNVGGLVGGNSSSTVIISYSTGSAMGTDNVGGLVGWNVTGTIVASYSSGNVMGTENVGGLAGFSGNGLFGSSNSGVVASYSTSSVVGTDNVGGLVGSSSSTISASWSSGSATGVNRVGGLIGQNNSDGTISASWSSGRATSTSSGDDIGGLTGRNSDGNIATSYWDTTTSLRIFGFGSDDGDNDNNLDNSDEDDNNNDMLDTGEDDDSDGRLDDGTETNRLGAENLGLTTAQMRAGTSPFPDFSATAQIIGTVEANRLGDFSAAWDYTAGCYPRLKRWTGVGVDRFYGTIDDTFHASELLPGQGTPAVMDGVCSTP